MVQCPPLQYFLPPHFLTMENPFPVRTTTRLRVSFAEGLVAEGLVAEGLVVEGLVAEGLVAEGLVAEGLVAEG